MLVTTSTLQLESSPSATKKKTKAPTFSTSLDSKVVLMERMDTSKFTKMVFLFNKTMKRTHLTIFKWITSCHSIWRKEMKSSCIMLLMIQSLFIAKLPSHSPVTKSKLKTKNCFKWNEFVIFCENFNFKKQSEKWKWFLCLVIFLLIFVKEFCFFYHCNFLIM